MSGSDYMIKNALAGFVGASFIICNAAVSSEFAFPVGNLNLQDTDVNANEISINSAQNNVTFAKNVELNTFDNNFSINPNNSKDAHVLAYTSYNSQNDDIDNLKITSTQLIDATTLKTINIDSKTDVLFIRDDLFLNSKTSEPPKEALPDDGNVKNEVKSGTEETPADTEVKNAVDATEAIPEATNVINKSDTVEPENTADVEQENSEDKIFIQKQNDVPVFDDVNSDNKSDDSVTVETNVNTDVKQSEVSPVNKEFKNDAKLVLPFDSKVIGVEEKDEQQNETEVFPENEINDTDISPEDNTSELQNQNKDIEQSEVESEVKQDDKVLQTDTEEVETKSEKTGDETIPERKQKYLTNPVPKIMSDFTGEYAPKPQNQSTGLKNMTNNFDFVDFVPKDKVSNPFIIGRNKFVKALVGRDLALSDQTKKIVATNFGVERNSDYGSIFVANNDIVNTDLNNDTAEPKEITVNTPQSIINGKHIVGSNIYHVQDSDVLERKYKMLTGSNLMINVTEKGKFDIFSDRVFDLVMDSKNDYKYFRKDANLPAYQNVQGDNQQQKETAEQVDTTSEIQETVEADIKNDKVDNDTGSIDDITTEKTSEENQEVVKDLIIEEAPTPHISQKKSFWNKLFGRSK